MFGLVFTNKHFIVYIMSKYVDYFFWNNNGYFKIETYIVDCIWIYYNDKISFENDETAFNPYFSNSLHNFQALPLGLLQILFLETLLA